MKIFNKKFTVFFFLILLICKSLIAKDNLFKLKENLKDEYLVEKPTITANFSFVCTQGSTVNLTVTNCSGIVNWFRTSPDYSSWNGLPSQNTASAYIYQKTGFFVSCKVNGETSAFSDTLFIDYSKVTIQSNDNLLCVGGTTVLNAVTIPNNGIVSYQWKLGGANIEGETNPSINAISAGSYSVAVNYSNNCTIYSNSFLLSSFGVVPNPVINGLSNITGPANKIFDKRFGGNNDESIVSIQNTADNEIILGGTTQNSTSNGIDISQNSRGQFDYLIIKTDSLGNKIWDKRYGGNYQNFLNQIRLTSNGDILAFGKSNSGISGDKTVGVIYDPNYGPVDDIWVVKMNDNGIKKWDKKFGGDGFEEIGDVLSLPNNEFLIGGSTNSGISGDISQVGRGSFDYWICKIDSSGTKLWEKRFGGAGNDKLKAITKTNDGGILLSGHSDSPISGEKTQNAVGYKDIWILKIDATGNKIWDKTIGNTSGFPVYTQSDLKVDADNNIILGVYTPDSESRLFKLNPEGNITWSKSFTNFNNIGKIKLNQTGILLVGATSFLNNTYFSSTPRGQSDGYLLQLDPLGNIIWDKVFGGTSSDIFNTFSEIGSDLIIGGGSRSGISFDKTQPSRGGEDFWILKVKFNEILSSPIGVSPNQTISLTTNNCPGNVTWTGGITAIGQSVTFNPTVNTVYTANCSAFGCVTSSNLEILPNCSESFAIVAKNSEGIPVLEPFICNENQGFFLEASNCSGTISWSNNQTGNSISVSPIIETTYSATCSGQNCAPITKTIKIKIFETPILNNQGPTTFCEGGSVILNSATSFEGYSFSWFKDENLIDGQNSSTLQATSSGNFKVKINKNGCSTFSNEIIVTENLIPAPPSFSKNEYFTCTGTPVQVYANGCNGTINWSNNESGNFAYLFTNNSTNYTATCTENGCISMSSQVKVSIGENNILGENIRYICNPSNHTLSSTLTSPNSNYEWYKDNILIQNQNSASINANQGGIYKSITTLNNGCIFVSNTIKIIDLTNANLPIYNSFQDISQKDTLLKLWDKSYGGTSLDLANKIIKTQDNNFLIVGTSYSGQTGNKTTLNKGQSDIYLIKIDSSGNKIWDKSFGTSLYDEGHSAVLTNDGNIFILGSSFTANDGDKTDLSLGDIDFWLIKIDNNGNKIWDKIYGSNEFETLPKIIKTTDNNYLIFGGKIALNFSTSNYLIYKINESGTILWSKTFSGGGSEVIKSASNTIDGGYIFSGDASNSTITLDKSQVSFGQSDFWVIKTDASGTKQWEKTYGGSDTEINSSIIQATDGSYFISGTSYSGVSGNKTSSNLGLGDFWILKINQTGNILWDKKFGGINNDFLNSQILNTSGNIISTGTTTSPNSDYISESSFDLPTGFQNKDTWMIEIEPLNGNPIFNKRFGGLAKDEIQDILIQNDNYYLLGSSNSIISGNKTSNNFDYIFDFWLLKTKNISEINSDSEVTIQSGQSIQLIANECPGIISWSNQDIGPETLVSPLINTTYTATCEYENCSFSSSVLIKVISCGQYENITQSENILSGTSANPIIKRAFNTIEATNKIGNINQNGSGKYIAGNSIILKPGFYVETGSIFQTRISQDPCNE